MILPIYHSKEVSTENRDVLDFRSEGVNGVSLSIGRYSGLQQNYIQNTGKAAGSGTAGTEQADKAAASRSQVSLQNMDVHEISRADADTSQRNDHAGKKPSDYSLTFLKNNDYSNFSPESSLGSQDMQQAISDMHKDSILQEYQYFVGSAQNVVQYASEDGTVIQKS